MSLFAQLCLAVEYIHSRNIVHRDITANNVLLNLNGTHTDTTLSVKLSDFGLSKILQCRRLSSTNPDSGEVVQAPTTGGKLGSRVSLAVASVLGTQEYIAPEILLGESFGKPADMWALGCLLFYMATHQLPFTGTNLHGLVMKITHGFPNLELIDRTIYEEALISIVCKLLEKEPAKRPHISALISNPFLLPHAINVGVNPTNV